MKPCVLHTGTSTGYRFEHWEGKTRLAHRVAYCKAHGLTSEDIEGKVVLHTCDNPPCKEPTHLVLGTQSQNIRDCVDKGRHVCPKGESHHNAKVTEAIVREIRAAAGSLKSVANRFGISVMTASEIRRRVTWKHVI